MAANGYEGATTLLIALNRITALRNYTSFERNKLAFSFSWFYDIVLICTLSYVTLDFEVHNLKYMPYNIERIVYTFLMLAQVAGIFWISVLGLYHSKSMLALTKRFDEVDETLRRIGCKAGYRDLHRHALIIGLSLIVNAVGMIGFYVGYSITRNTEWTVIVSSASFLLGSNVGSVMLYEFKTAVYWLGLRFKETNELLQTFLTEDRRMKNDEISEENVGRANGIFRQRFRPGGWLSEYPVRSVRVHPVDNAPNSRQETRIANKVHLLQQIRFAHLQLCCTSKMLNQTFDAQLFSYAAVILVYITVLLYYMYMEYRRHLYLDVNFDFIALYGLDIFLNCLKIGLVSYSCEYTTQQATKAVEILHGCSIHRIDNELKDEIHQFCLQISHTQLGKSKSAFFRLNYGFIRDCISFVATYLIIIIQWSQNLQLGVPIAIANQTKVTSAENSTQELNVYG